MKKAKDLKTLEGYPSPQEIKNFVVRAMIYLDILADKVKQPDFNLDWGWARFATMLMVGIIFFGTIACSKYRTMSRDRCQSLGFRC